MPCYSIHKMCIKKAKFHMYFWAYNVVILFVLRSRFRIERLEDNGKIFFFLYRVKLFCYLYYVQFYITCVLLLLPEI